MSTPFSRKFVLDVTLRAVRAAIRYSMDRTCSRIAEFQHDPAKSLEVQKTLQDLHLMSSAIDTLDKSFKESK